MYQIKKDISKIIYTSIESTISDFKTFDLDICDLMEYPPDSNMGDISLPCFKLSKIFRKPPQKIAEEIAKNLLSQNIESIKSIETLNGYLNVFIKENVLADVILKEIFERENKYGSENIGNGEKVVMDYSSPNIAKPFHVGHLRTTVIGNAINKILTFMGYNCYAINYLGDWGTQFGKVITAYKLWCNDIKVIEENGVTELSVLYVKFHDEAEKDPSLKDTAREWFKKLENGDEEALYLWKKFRDISLAEFMKTYELTGIKFDSFDGESSFNDKMDAVVEELREKNLLKIDNGASIVDLSEYKMPPCLILKTDGTSLYPTRDIASALYRKHTFNFAKNLYVVSVSQSLHFSQWIKVLELMGYEWANDCVHINFGNISIEGQIMGTRKGNTLLLEDIFNNSIEKVKSIIDEKSPDMPEDEKNIIAKKVGVGAIIFYDLSNNRIKDYDFSWSEVLNFDGNSGPYVQYTYARICGVLKKAETANVKEDELKTGVCGTITDEAEKELLKFLSLFPDKVNIAARDYEPSVISRYMLDLCALFNRFYNNCKILKAESNEIMMFRIKLTKATKIVLGIALELIGLEKTEVV